MSNKTRYLQLSDTTLFEFDMLNENDTRSVSSADELCKAFILTKLLNGHYATFSPVSFEVSSVSETGGSLYNPRRMKSVNTLNHLSVPEDKREASWFTFFDNSLRFVDASIMNSIDVANIKAEQYAKYCSCPVSEEIDPEQNIFYYQNITDLESAPRWDVARLYFTSGYDFSDTFGVTLRLSVERNDRASLDLCNFYYDKGSVYKYMQYMASPIIFGNVIYDKYIEIKVPCLYDLLYGRAYFENADASQMCSLFDISQRTAIKISFAYTDSDDYTVSEIDLDQARLVRGINYNQETNCTYTKSNSITGTVPYTKTSSDNLGVYIAEDPDYPFIEFCGTWRGDPLTQETVYNFNRSIQLYDRSLIHTGESAYEVDEDYEVDTPAIQWVAVHQITCTFYKEDEEDELVVAKTETYTMNQDFSTTQTVFKYRPVLFDTEEVNEIVMVSFEYVMRLINTRDGVQFTKRGTLSATDIQKYFAKEINLDLSSMSPYKVYNRVIENQQNISTGSANARLKTKYVKVFYDTTTVTLDQDGNAYSNREYTLSLARSPKTYKFVFRQEDYNNNLKYLDLSDAYYKLYCRSVSGSEIIVEPTYSSNMNLVLGELEFNITSSTINKLYLVPEADRILSIIVQNDDNTISTMFEMRFTFA